MDATITFSSETVKELTYRLRLAWRAGKQWLIKQLSALLLLSDRQEVYTIASGSLVVTCAIFVKTVYHESVFTNSAQRGA